MRSHGREVYEAVIFDLDGVLMDSEKIHGEAWKKVFSDAGKVSPPGIPDRFIGVSESETAAVLHAEGMFSESRQELLERKQRNFIRLLSEIRPFPGTVKAVGSLAGSLPMAVATSTCRKEADIMLEIGELSGYFRFVAAAEDAARKKPDPEIYETACSRLGKDPEQVLVVEDSPFGIQAAKAAGCYVVGVANSLDPAELYLADAVVENTPAAVELIRQLTNSAGRKA